MPFRMQQERNQLERQRRRHRGIDAAHLGPGQLESNELAVDARGAMTRNNDLARGHQPKLGACLLETFPLALKNTEAGPIPG